MFGVNSITSIINPPHSLILGVGKSEKKIVFDENSKDETRPYKVANIMTVIASADHRVVDGALAGQWIVRIKKYLESPLHMLL
jgi:pyruvate dehydrogenase E2 component (dihydrolipoamide acetyltransferase)